MGIGTSTPGNKFHVVGSTGTDITNVQAGAGIFVSNGGSTGVAIGSEGNVNRPVIQGVGAGAVLNLLLNPYGGNIGIGTTSPFGQLHVNSATNDIVTRFTNTFTGTTATDGTMIEVGSSGHTYLWNYESANMYFGVNNASAMTILSSGNVGIGTETPQSKLQILGTTGDASGTAGAAAILSMQSGSGTDLVFGSMVGSPFTSWIQHRHATNNSSYFPIALNPLGGNVGIGTVSPAAKLEIDQTSGSNFLEMRNSSLVSRASWVYIPVTNGNNTDLRLYEVRPDGGSDYRVSFQSNGNVGIGTVSPSHKLHLVSGTANVALRASSTYSGVQVWKPADGANDYTEFIVANELGTETKYVTLGMGEGTGKRLSTAATDDAYLTTIGASNLLFGTNSTEYMRINTSGNVGIGTTNPISKFVVSNSGALGYEINPTADSGETMQILSYNRSTTSYKKLSQWALSHELLVNGGDVALTIKNDGNFVLNGYEPVTSYLAAYKIFNAGGFGFMYRSDYDSYIMSNAQYNSGSSVVAKYSTAEGLAQLSFAGGTLNWLTYNGSVTAGNAYALTQRFSVAKDGATTISSLVSCGGIQTNGSGTMSCTSDETLKDIEGEFTQGLEAIREINPIAFSWKNNSGLYDDGVIYYGFSAQNVQAALPEAISLSSGNKLQVSQLTLMATAINAIKELDIKVQSLPTFENPTLATKVAEFLSGIAEGVANIGRVNTDTLCVGNTCVTESQLQQLLQQASVSSGNSTPPEETPPADPTCTDGIQNQDETGIDEGGVCAPQVDPEPTPDPTCSDGILNQDETEIDIGGVCTPVEPTPEQTPPTP